VNYLFKFLLFFEHKLISVFEVLKVIKDHSIVCIKSVFHWI